MFSALNFTLPPTVWTHSSSPLTEFNVPASKDEQTALGLKSTAFPPQNCVLLNEWLIVQHENSHSSEVVS